MIQLCHPDLVNEFPPLRVSKAVISQRLPVQFTSFVGRDEQLAQVRELLTQNRLVTLTGAGGVGKTRMAIEIAAPAFRRVRRRGLVCGSGADHRPRLVPITVARAFGLPDQPGRSTMDTLLRFVADRQMLVVLDNCEHLLDASAALVVALLGAAPGLTLLRPAVSRSASPVSSVGGCRPCPWPTRPIELFSDRARRARPDFVVTDDNAATVTEICRALTESHWRSSWRPPGCGRCRWPRFWTACMTGSGC